MQPRRVNKLCAIAILALALGATTTAHGQVISLHDVTHADPVRDFNAAIGRGDLRFIAVDGLVGGFVPGVDQDGIDRSLIAAHGKRTIRGTSDSGEVKLNQLAHKYAERYNVLLLHYLREQTKRPNHAVERTASCPYA